MRRTGFIVIAVALLAASGFAEEPSNPGRPLKSSTGAMLRSLVVPGWGQYYNEDYVRAGAYFVVESSLLYGISWNHDLLMRFKTGNNSIKEKFHRNQRNELLWWLAGTLLLSMGDAYVGAHMYKLDLSPEISTDGSEPAPGMRLVLRF